MRFQVLTPGSQSLSGTDRCSQEVSGHAHSHPSSRDLSRHHTAPSHPPFPNCPTRLVMVAAGFSEQGHPGVPGEGVRNGCGQ